MNVPFLLFFQGFPLMLVSEREIDKGVIKIFTTKKNEV